jgi:hypothetical protein
MPAGNPGFYKKDDREKATELGIISGRMKIFYYINRFWKISGLEKRLFIKSLILNIVYSFVVRMLPLKSYSSHLKTRNIKHINYKDREKAFYLIRKTINRISIILPWRTKCLIKSLIFKHLSNSLGIHCTLAIEIFRGSSNKLNAHAYILDENEPIYLFRKNSSNNILYKGDMK